MICECSSCLPDMVFCVCVCVCVCVCAHTRLGKERVKVAVVSIIEYHADLSCSYLTNSFLVWMLARESEVLHFAIF